MSSPDPRIVRAMAIALAEDIGGNRVELDPKLVATVTLALAKLYEAGFDCFGFPQDTLSMKEKAETYAEALLPDDDADPMTPVLDVATIHRATARLVRSGPSGDGKPQKMPTAGAFREICLSEWHRTFRFASKPMLNRDGIEVEIAVQVPRGATDEEVERALAPRLRQAREHGYRPPALPERCDGQA